MALLGQEEERPTPLLLSPFLIPNHPFLSCVLFYPDAMAEGSEVKRGCIRLKEGLWQCEVPGCGFKKACGRTTAYEHGSTHPDWKLSVLTVRAQGHSVDHGEWKERDRVV